VPDHRQAWEAESIRLRSQLRDSVLGGFPAVVSPEVSVRRGQMPDSLTIEMTPEQGLHLRAEIRTAGAGEGRPLERRGSLIVLGAASLKPELLASRLEPWHKSGYSPVVVELRATGRLKPRTDPVAGVADHHEAEWGVWLGRPLVGQWVWDTLRWIDVLDQLRRNDRTLGKAELAGSLGLLAFGAAGVVALLAAAFDQRIGQVMVENCPISFVPPSPSVWRDIPMGIIAPGILQVADVAQIAALLAPRPLRFGGGIEIDGNRAAAGRVRRSLAFTRSVYDLLGSTGLKFEPDRTGTGQGPDDAEKGRS
jgi:hypothetical protein